MRYSSEVVDSPLDADLQARLEIHPLLALPGFAGHEVSKPGTGESVYPSGTGDLIKLAREGGADIDYAFPDEPRVTVSLNAAEYWVPILVMLKDLLVRVEGALLADAIREWTGGKPTYVAEETDADEPEVDERTTVLHVRLGAADLRAGSVQFFEASGAREDVLEGLREFRERL